MNEEANPVTDWSPAHKHFSAHCFNQVWTYIEKENRTADEKEKMLHLAHASFYHWTERADFTPQHESIGLWQLSRVHHLASQSTLAVHYAKRCINISESAKLEPFYIAYAYEAMAYAQCEIGLRDQARAAAEYAHKLSEDVTDKNEREQLLKDLEAVEERLSGD